MGSASSKVPGDTYRLLMVGMTGSGKSSTGNSILGTPAFHTASGWNSATKECSLQCATRDNITFEVMDTPGFSDYGKSQEDIAATITRFLAGVSPGPHAVLFVMSATSRFTKEVHTAYTEAKKLFGEGELVSRIILVFTGGDNLTKKHVDIMSQIDNSVIQMKEIFAEVDERYVVFDNSATGSAQKRQLETLLALVRDVCGADISYLSNPAQTKINEVIAGEAAKVSDKRSIPLDEAKNQIRQALVDATMDDPFLVQATDRIIQEIKENKINLNINRCTLL